ncbi:MAG: methyltransferase domain-containing protein [Flavobacteriales bacterium]|nr:methyltransferase domain-containing protein [Flavobacteriales bacterium]
MKGLYPFLNPLEWIKARKFARQNAKFDKSSYDLELFLYSKMLTNNMLHYGYFDDIDTRPETISFEQFEYAQMRYAENIIEHLDHKEDLVLDVGCGMGGLSQLLSEKGFKVESLTPNKNQIEFINANHPHLTTYDCKYEDLKTSKKYGTVINSESLQYISLKAAFQKTESIILPKGKWVIVDYFSLEKKGENQRPHHIDTFYKEAGSFGWKITYEQDITPNILPTLKYVEMYVNRILLPVKHFAYEKLRYKSPRIFYLSRKVRESVDKKFEKERKTIDPAVFQKERKYILMVLEKS